VKEARQAKRRKRQSGRQQTQAAALWIGAAGFGLILILAALRSRLEVPGEQAALQAYRNRASGIWVRVQGKVFRVLPDDTEGAPHQRFLIRTSTGQTLLVAYNLGGRRRIPLRRGDAVQVRGEYEWSPRGGVIHNAHRSTVRAAPAGWIRLMRNETKYD
jgi:hypothetical protein